MKNYGTNYSSSRRIDGAKPALFALFVLLTVLVVGGCAPVRPPTSLLPPVSADTLLASLQAGGQRFRSLQGMTALRVTHAGEEHAVKQVLLVRRPDFLRAEVLGLFGQPVLTVTAADDRLSALVPGESKFYTGPASSANLYRLVRLPLALEELVPFIFYDVPLLPLPSGEVAIKDGLYQLDRCSRDGRRQELLFDGKLRLRQARFFADDVELLMAEYGNMRDGDNLPQQLHLALPAVDMAIDLVWRNVRANVDIPLSRFEQSPPAGVQVEALP
ncbi:hypothetical protein Pcar_1871 [Syntrophotalea carbinolica DSM 2380]|uniref:DUF4292 domain-containing protein n=1 Tax=Syntrophotalea carbinolica (strain DSM 2380 / NBRC 103641 / GraBd1) TaxID=338963 RepID=Q3A3E5_SYNC1|nr:hypothetical protein [Syntrophotalea carbinolica]ABA89112.1 hypothetical protein Pcar_1871 [Syntrophotalea carbinolica DSM 2380]